MGNPHIRHSHHGLWNIRANYNTTIVYNVTTTVLPDNITNFTNHTEEERLSPLFKAMYLYVSSLLILFCVISILANVVLLLSVCWIRTRISPTLHISLSLAAADTFALFMFATGLLINSLLPVAMGIHLSDCFSLCLEAFRMGGMITTLLHLLALAVNHYLGILSPLQYPSYMTRKNIQYCAFFIWTIPSLSLIAYFHFLEDGFSTPTCSYDFIKKAKFRTRFFLIFFTSLVIMIFIYSHIYNLVRHHQETRLQYCNTGSSYSRNRITANEKAIFTTLLIVGSVIIGWMPAVSYFFLVCKNCWINNEWGTNTWRFTVNSILNLLIILKNASNSYIYAYRMKEIKLAIRSMKNQILRSCGNVPRDNETLYGLSSENALSRSSTRRGRRTVVCRLQAYPNSRDGQRLLRSQSSTTIRRFSSNNFRRRDDNFNTSL